MAANKAVTELRYHFLLLRYYVLAMLKDQTLREWDKISEILIQK